MTTLSLFLGFFGIIIFAVGIIGVLVLLILKKPKKKAGIAALIGFTMLIIGSIILPIDEDADAVETAKVTQKEEKPKEEKPKEEKKETPVVVPSKEEAKDKPAEVVDATAKTPVELVKVLDGDTITVNYEGEEKTVKYLLIDAPEMNHPKLGKQRLAEKAMVKNKELLESGQLEIEFDEGERYDTSDHLLAYVYVGGKSVQKMLLSEGLVRVAASDSTNTRYVEAYEDSQSLAKEKKLGIWSIPNYVTADGFSEQKAVSKQPVKPAPVPPKTKPTPTPPKEKPVTPTPAPRVEKPVAPAPPAVQPIAPTPPPAATQPERFQNCTELRKTYPNGVPEGHPAYESKMDRDNDGFACEK